MIKTKRTVHLVKSKYVILYFVLTFKYPNATHYILTHNGQGWTVSMQNKLYTLLSSLIRLNRHILTLSN